MAGQDRGAHIAGPAAHVVVVADLHILLAAAGAEPDARALAQHLAVRMVARLHHHAARRAWWSDAA